MKRKYKKLIVLLAVLTIVTMFFVMGFHEYLTLGYFKDQKIEIERFYSENRGFTLFIYFLIYVLTTALSLPGATVLTLAGGAIFGLSTGLLVISFASTIGATLAFLGARFLFRDLIQSRFQQHLGTFNSGFEREGSFYLFSLRLIPIFPFFLINLLMGLTSIRVRNFYWVSQIGMLPGTVVYVNAGTELGKITSLKGILSPSLLFAFVLLGLVPIFSKRVIAYWRKRREEI